MNREVVILIAEDDIGHAGLIMKNLGRAGLKNELVHFRDGQEVLDFFLGSGPGPHWQPEEAYLLLLDIRMPKVDGIEVLTRLKADPELRGVPVIMITTADDPREVGRCHDVGCASYITKPVDYDQFVEVIRQLGLYLAVVQVPCVGDGSA
jgi:CheY-like chemotaxis protein